MTALGRKAIFDLIQIPMRNRKLYHLLVLLDATEWDAFDVFIRSPYHNTNPTMVVFWELWWSRLLQAEEKTSLSPEEFVAGSSIKVERVAALCRDLMTLVRKFLAVRSLENSPALNTLLFAQSVLNRDPGLHTSHRFLPQLEKELFRQPESPEKHLSVLYFEAMQSRNRILARKADADWLSEFNHLHNLLEEFVLTKGLELSCGVVNAVRIFRGEGELPENGFYSSYLSSHTHEKESLLPQLYRLSLSLLLGAEEAETFSTILSILEHHREEILPSIRNDVFSFSLNFCIRKINQGDESYLINAFELYRLLIQSGDLLIKGKLSPQQYKNLISLGCRVGKLDWVSDFVEQYAGLLSDDHHGLAQRYNRAVLLFYQSDFETAIHLFRGVVSDPSYDVFYGLDARFYLWKSYFEFRANLSPDAVDDMYRLYDSLRVYVDRSTSISERHQKQYRNLLRLFKGFIQTLDNPDPKKRVRRLYNLRTKLMSQDVANVTWFSQKVEEALTREQS